MTLDTWLLPMEWLLPIAGLALASLTIPLCGLLMARCFARSRYPIRHGVLLASLVVLGALPFVTAASQRLGLGWQVSLAGRQGITVDPEAPAIVPSLSEREVENVFATEEPLFVAGVPVNQAARESGAADGRLNELADSGAGDRGESEEAAVRVLESDDGRSLRAWQLFGTVLTVVWFIVGLLSLVGMWRAAKGIKKYVATCQLCTTPELARLLSDCSRHIGLRSVPQLCLGTDLPTPFVYGVRRPHVVVPEHCLERCERSMLRAMLLHELAHIRRRDLLVGLLQRVVQAIYWWNPVVRRVNAEIDDVREDLCDNFVLVHGSDRAQYANALVTLASEAVTPSVAPALGLLSRPSRRLTGRIQRILNEERTMSTRLGGVSKVLLVLFVFALGVGTTLLSFRVGEVIDAADDIRVSFVELRESEAVDVASNVTAGNPMVFISDTAEPSPVPAPNTDVASAEAAEGDFQAQLNEEPFQIDEFGPSTFDHDTVTEAPGALPESPEFDSGLESGETAQFEPFATDAATFDPPPEPDSGFGLPAGSGVMPPSLPLGGPPAVRLSHSLVLIELTAGLDGGLGGIRYLTEDLGGDEKAFTLLAERITSLAKQLEAERTGQQIEVQLSADSELRYQHVARVVEVCAQHVDRVVFASARPAADEIVTLSIGFVRDGQGRKIASTPVLVWQGELVPYAQLAARLREWYLPQPELPERVTMTLRSDPGVPADFVRGVIRAAQAARFTKFTLKTLLPTPPPVEGMISQVSVDGDDRKFLISIGSDDGLVEGHELIVSLPPGTATNGSRIVGRLSVISVAPDSAICIPVPMRSSGLDPVPTRAIQEGYTVRTVPLEEPDAAGVDPLSGGEAPAEGASPLGPPVENDSVF